MRNESFVRGNYQRQNKSLGGWCYLCTMNFSAMKASQGIATTKSSTNTQNGDINSPEAIEQGNIAAAATGEEIFNDSGVFVEHYEFYPSAPGLEYKDFQIHTCGSSSSNHLSPPPEQLQWDRL
ncbi:hypothetical protein WAI453_012713 [Rhynchosporium graminicola]